MTTGQSLIRFQSMNPVLGPPEETPQQSKIRRSHLGTSNDFGESLPQRLPLVLTEESDQPQHLKEMSFEPLDFPGSGSSQRGKLPLEGVDVRRVHLLQALILRAQV